MKDRVPLYPGRVKLVPVSGQENVYDMTRADQPTQQGDPLNKATLLKDSTAELFGLGTDAVPDDVLQKLAGAAFDSGGTITDVNGNPLGVRIATGSYVGTGKYGPDNPNSLTFEFPPKLLFITQYNGDGNFYGANSIDRNPMDCSILTTSYTAGLGFSNVSSSDGLSGYAKKTEDGKTITWYHSRSADSQANYAQYTYYYFAIG